jgi:hypothetical protein
MHERSGGIPRTLNVIADNALLTAFATGRRPVNSKVVLEVCRDLDLGGDAAATPTPNTAAPADVAAAPSGPVRLITIESGGAPSDAAAEPRGRAKPKRRRFSMFRTTPITSIRGTE